MLIDKEGIRALIPHAGKMCLLDGVITWDDESIACMSGTHRDPANPLRRGARLSALHALEYGAQAAAIHGGLRARSAGAPLPSAYLVAFRDVRLFVERLDDITFALDIRAARILGDAGNAIYESHVLADGDLLVQGRITIMLPTGPALKRG
jgi:predicted hotdog family 3-hydroxylacyl-ACP dehydratase